MRSSAVESNDAASCFDVWSSQARSLMEFSNKVIELGRQGVTDFRGRTNSIARAHNAQIAEEERAAREAARSAERCLHSEFQRPQPVPDPWHQ